MEKRPSKNLSKTQKVTSTQANHIKGCDNVLDGGHLLSGNISSEWPCKNVAQIQETIQEGHAENKFCFIHDQSKAALKFFSFMERVIDCQRLQAQMDQGLMTQEEALREARAEFLDCAIRGKVCVVYLGLATLKMDKKGNWNNRFFPSERFFSKALLHKQIDRLTSAAEKTDASGNQTENFQIHENFQLVILSECVDHNLVDVLDNIPHDRAMFKFHIPNALSENNYTPDTLLKGRNAPAFVGPIELSDHFKEVKFNVESRDPTLVRELILYPEIEYLQTMSRKQMREHHFKGMEWNKTDRIQSLTFVFTDYRQGSDQVKLEGGPSRCPPKGTYEFDPLVTVGLPLAIHIDKYVFGIHSCGDGENRLTSILLTNNEDKVIRKATSNNTCNRPNIEILAHKQERLVGAQMTTYGNDVQKIQLMFFNCTVRKDA